MTVCIEISQNLKLENWNPEISSKDKILLAIYVSDSRLSSRIIVLLIFLLSLPTLFTRWRRSSSFFLFFPSLPRLNVLFQLYKKAKTKCQILYRCPLYNKKFEYSCLKFNLLYFYRIIRINNRILEEQQTISSNKYTIKFWTYKVYEKFERRESKVIQSIF